MEFNLNKSFDSSKREYSYRTESQVDNLIPDTFIDLSDPIHQLKQLSGIANPGHLQEYKDAPVSHNTMLSDASQKIKYQNDNNVQSGTPEWFRLWFSKP